MKRISIILIIASVFCLGFGFDAYATEEIKDEISEKLFSENNEITEILEDFGITSLDYESIYNISFKSIFLYYKDAFSDYITGCVRLFSKVLSVIILGGSVSFIADDRKYKSIITVLLVPIVILLLTGEINLCLSSAVSLMKLNGSFMLSFVPVYAITVAIAGNPSAAITYNSLVIGIAELVSAIINYGFTDIIGCYFCLCIGLSVNESVNFPRFISSVNRLITFCLGLVSSIFTAFLSVKGIFSAAADSVASKSIRFVMGSLIPVIGSSLSDAYSTLMGSLGILKSSVAIVGIIAVILINLPVLFEIVLFNISLNALSFISELFDNNPLTNILRAFACGVKVIGLLVTFEAFVLIISTAIMLSFRGG